MVLQIKRLLALVIVVEVALTLFGVNNPANYPLIPGGSLSFSKSKTIFS